MGVQKKMRIREWITQVINDDTEGNLQETPRLALHIEQELRKLAGEGNRQRPKYLALQLRDAQLEPVDCPYFVLVAEDTHAKVALMAYLSALATCNRQRGTRHDEDAVIDSYEAFDEWPRRNELC